MKSSDRIILPFSQWNPLIHLKTPYSGPSICSVKGHTPIWSKYYVWTEEPSTMLLISDCSLLRQQEGDVIPHIPPVGVSIRWTKEATLNGKIEKSAAEIILAGYIWRFISIAAYPSVNMLLPARMCTFKQNISHEAAACFIKTYSSPSTATKTDQLNVQMSYTIPWPLFSSAGNSPGTHLHMYSTSWRMPPHPFSVNNNGRYDIPQMFHPSSSLRGNGSWTYRYRMRKQYPPTNLICSDWPAHQKLFMAEFRVATGPSLNELPYQSFTYLLVQAASKSFTPASSRALPL